jgi:outer membrane protein TolC
MPGKRLSLTLFLIFGLASAFGQQEPRDEDYTTLEALPVEEEGGNAAPIDPDAEPLAVDSLPDTAQQVRLTYDDILAAPSGRTLQEEISIDLIDLDALREALELKSSIQPLRLSLDECIALALAQNPDIIISGLEPQKSDMDIFSARGEFDPIWQTTMQHVRASMALSQQYQRFGGLKSLDSWTTTLDSTVGGKLHTGTQYALVFNLNKEETTYGNFIEEFDTRLMLNLTQPLLKGFGFKVNKVRINMAKNARIMTEAQARLQMMTTISDVIKAYWDLVGMVENVRVRQESLANAERLLQINETRREIGTAADIEVLQAKAGVATRQSELIASRSRMSDASDILKQLLDLREGDMFSKALIVPTDRPSVTDASEINLDRFEEQFNESLELALRNRPEIEIADLQVINAELDAMRMRNEMLPELNITGSYGQGGRDHKLSQSLYKLRDEEQQFYSYGLTATVPLRNRATRGAYERAKLTQREMELREHKMRQAVQLNVHLALRNVLTNQILVESNRQARRLQEANVIAETKRLRMGVTTSWQLLRVEEDLTAAQTLEVQAQTAYEKALIDLFLAEGTLLDKLNITFGLPETEKPIGYFSSIRPRWE